VTDAYIRELEEESALLKRMQVIVSGDDAVTLERLRTRYAKVVDRVKAAAEAQALAEEALRRSVTTARKAVPVECDPEQTTALALRRYIRRGEGTHLATKEDRILGWEWINVVFSRRGDGKDDTLDDGTGTTIVVTIDYDDGRHSDDYAFEYKWTGYMDTTE